MSCCQPNDAATDHTLGASGADQCCSTGERQAHTSGADAPAAPVQH